MDFISYVKKLRNVRFDDGFSVRAAYILPVPGDYDHEFVRFGKWFDDRARAVKFCKDWKAVPGNDCYVVDHTSVSYQHGSYKAIVYLKAAVGHYSTTNYFEPI